MSDTHDPNIGMSDQSQSNGAAVLLTILAAAIQMRKKGRSRR